MNRIYLGKGIAIWEGSLPIQSSVKLKHYWNLLNLKY